MKLKTSTKIIIAVVVVVLVIICGYVLFVEKTANNGAHTGTQQVAPVTYQNGQYGFTFSLPQDWSGYSIVTSTWDGYASGPTGDIPYDNGPMISIRNPKWTAQTPYQDIPIMVFTISQWNDLQNNAFHIGAAPIGPSELGRNSNYVFALPARYNFAFPAGFQEVETILQGNPLKTGM